MKKLGLLILATLGLTGCGIDINININHIPPVEIKNSSECKPEKESNPMAENKIENPLKDALAIYKKNNKPEEDKIRELTEIYQKYIKDLNTYKNSENYKFYSYVYENSSEFKDLVGRLKSRVNPGLFWGLLLDDPGIFDMRNPKGRVDPKYYYGLPEIPEELLSLFAEPYSYGDNEKGRLHIKAMRPVFREFLEKQGYNVDDLANVGRAYFDPEVSNGEIEGMLRFVASQTPNQRLTQAMIDTRENKADANNWDKSIEKNLPNYPESSLPPSYARPSRDKVPVAPALTLMEILTGKSPEKPKTIEPATVPVTTPVATPTPVTADTLDTSFDNIEYDYDSPGGSINYTPPVRYALTPEERDALSTRIAEAMVKARQAEIDPTRTRKLGDLSYLRGY